MVDQSDDDNSLSERSTTQKRGHISTLHRTLLSILHHESTIALDRPLLAKLAKKPATSASHAALQSCIHASRAIIETLDDPQILGQEGAAGETAPTQALVAWPLMTWSVWMSCFILTFAALEGVTSPSSAQG